MPRPVPALSPYQSARAKHAELADQVANLEHVVAFRAGVDNLSRLSSRRQTIETEATEVRASIRAAKADPRRRRVAADALVVGAELAAQVSPPRAAELCDLPDVAALEARLDALKEEASRLPDAIREQERVNEVLRVAASKDAAKLTRPLRVKAGEAALVAMDALDAASWDLEILADIVDALDLPVRGVLHAPTRFGGFVDGAGIQNDRRGLFAADLEALKAAR